MPYENSGQKLLLLNHKIDDSIIYMYFFVVTVYRYLLFAYIYIFFMSLGFPTKQGLLIKQNLSFLPV